jgi:hypothetical protein
MLKPFARHFALCVALLAPALLQAETALREGLWEVSVRMDIGGQPASAEPLVTRQCITQQTAQDLINQLAGTAAGCQVANLQQEGNRASWDLTCSGQVDVRGSGQLTLSSGGFEGSLDAWVGMSGQSIPVHQTFSARRVGDCQ